MLKASDPELIPENTWATIHSQINTCLQHITTYLSDKNITRIKNANTSLDAILAQIRPYHVSTGKAAKAASASFSAYAKAIDKSLSSFQDAVKATHDEIQEYKQTSLDNSTEIEDTRVKIKQLENNYFDDSDAESLSTRVNQLESSLSESFDRIETFKSKIFEGDDETSSISKTIADTHDKVDSDSQGITEALQAMENQLEELSSYHTDVFGVRNDNGELEGGLKNEIEIRKKALEEFKNQQITRYEALNSEIESLLPGATSAGMANAYLEMRNSFDEPLRTYTKIFYGSVSALAIVSLISITQEVSWTYIKFVEINDFKMLLSNLLYKLPVVLPVLWLALFASKRRNEASRLQQEYAHKEVTAKSYQSFKTQIEALNRSDPQLMEKLLDSAIDTVSSNSSSTLDKKHDEKMPIQDGLESFMKNASKMKDILNK